MSLKREIWFDRSLRVKKGDFNAYMRRISDGNLDKSKLQPKNCCYRSA